MNLEDKCSIRVVKKEKKKMANQIDYASIWRTAFTCPSLRNIVRSRAFGDTSTHYYCGPVPIYPGGWTDLFGHYHYCNPYSGCRTIHPHQHYDSRSISITYYCLTPGCPSPCYYSFDKIRLKCAECGCQMLPTYPHNVLIDLLDDDASDSSIDDLPDYVYWLRGGSVYTLKETC